MSASGGVDPAWAANGSELYFRRGDAILAVPVRTAGRFETLGPAVELFAGPFDFTQVTNWDVMPDGRFLMIRSNTPTTTRLQVVLNWFDELKGKGAQ